MSICVYDSLPDEAVEIRENVFVKEEGFEKEFEKLGSCGYGAEDEDEGCPHCWMKKKI